MGGDGSVARVWAGVDRRWGGRRAGWLLVRGWTGRWIETRGDGCGSGGRGWVGGKRWLGCLCVSRVGTLCPSTPPPPFLATSATAPARPALPVQLPPQNAPHRDDVYGCVCGACSICVCICMYVDACERSRALIYVAPMCYTLQTSPPFTRGYSMCRICS